MKHLIKYAFFSGILDFDIFGMKMWPVPILPESPDWRDEDGCGDQTEGRSRTRISNIDDIQYVIFVLERLIRMEHQLHIMRTAVNVNPDEEVLLMDKDGKLGKFAPKAIIHHSGNVRGQTTQGHHRADVKNKETESWFRTSDNEPPESLSVNGLTRMGYIFCTKNQIQSHWIEMLLLTSLLMFPWMDGPNLKNY